jgi:integrase
MDTFEESEGDEWDAGADRQLLQNTMDHASITVTAHIYADPCDDELDDVASALNSLDDSRQDGA